MNKALLPDHFINFITPCLPSHLNLQDFIDYCGKPLRKSIRVNTLKISTEEFVEKATQQGWQLTSIPWCKDGFWLQRPEEQEQQIQLGNTLSHLTGEFYIQEASSMLPPIALLYKQGHELDLTCLDVAAAPGSKTTQMAALLNNQGVIVANEFSSSRIKVLSANVQRCAVTNTALTHMDGRMFIHLKEQFDAILLDAPCSGEGTVRKDVDSMKNWTEQSVHDIAGVQRDLIDAAFHALKPNGVMIYSTCTLNQIENQQVCLWLKEQYGDAVEFESLADLFEGAENSTTAEGFLHVWPQIYDSEGFFVARIRKTASIAHQLDNPFAKLGQFPFKPLSNKNSQQLREFLSTQFSMDNFPLEACSQRETKKALEIWYFPPKLEALKGKVKFARVGVKLAELAKHGFKLEHSLAINFAQLANKQTQELNAEQCQAYWQGKDIDGDFAKLKKGEVIVCYQGQALGFAKKLPDRLKNQLPRELVRDNLDFSEFL
ncbi:16S rRNA (cytosine(1407)-C(5))-methyltransferase RsmF [Catenovulum agarivorans]|uniref:16S rRNA (cytosine(1407)-C(5))-methyltransferase RsmF n=1 Tax=Catenovulum agarivorans TaxID=1172192 RepID=UPI0002E25A3B|nr:16S rRNA (cytosine(1407)-C(5))-methyltransferase RsmF [Catenovulum agarivorans]